MRRITKYFVLFLVGACGCANAWQTSYVGGSAAAKFVTETHKIAWSEPLNAKTRECDPAHNPKIQSEKDLEACLGIFTRNPEVVAALKKYNATAEILEQILLATDPNKPDSAKLLAAWNDVLDAALDLVDLFPDGARYTHQLRILTRGL